METEEIYISFIYPFESNFPLLWVFYKQLFHLRKKLIFWGTKDYYDTLIKNKKIPNLWYYKYEFLRLPDIENIEHLHFFDLKKFNNILPLKEEAWVKYILANKRFPELENYFHENLIKAQKKFNIKSILAWRYTKSLSVVCKKLGLTIIYNEIGPLRKPFYRQTAYFDFLGLHSNTEVKKRFKIFKKYIKKEKLLTPQELRKLFQKKNFNSEKKYDFGVALADEDNFKIRPKNALLLKYLKKLKTNNNKLLLRPFPSSKKDYSNLGVEVDSTLNSIEFIKSIDKIVTYDSNIGAEAMFYEKDVISLGDTPYKQFYKMDKEEKLYFLNFFFLSYLIPYEFLFNDEYYDFRLKYPSEKEIFELHLKHYERYFDSFLFYNNFNKERLFNLLDSFIINEYYDVQKKREKFLNNKIKKYEKSLKYLKLLYKSNIAIFGLGKSGKMTYSFIKEYYPKKIKYFIDDNVKGKYDRIPIVTTDEFLEKHQDKVDLVVFGKYQHLNPKLIPNLKVDYLRLDNII